MNWLVAETLLSVAETLLSEGAVRLVKDNYVNLFDLENVRSVNFCFVTIISLANSGGATE
jgi:hypothetical protein